MLQWCWCDSREICAVDEEEGDFYYDQEEALQAGNLDESMLDHLDSLITMPRADELNEVHLSWGL